MRSRSRVIRNFELALFIVLACTFVGVFFASQKQTEAFARNQPAEDWRETAVMTVVSVVLAPLVMAIAWRLPVEHPHAVRNATLLLVIAIPFAFGRAALDAAIPPLFAHVSIAARPFWNVVARAVHTDLVFFFAIAGVTNYIRIQRRGAEQRRREAEAESNLIHAQLRRLRGDLQPHFLFNTLNDVAALAHTQPRAAEEAIAKLADLLQRTLEVDRADVPLSEELDFIGHYLDLQKLRFGDRLRTNIEVADPSLLSTRVPTLLLQPLVENSIVHGIRKRAEGGTVTIRAFADGGTLHFEVRDSGPGCDPSQPFAHGNIGVGNTVARLEYLYGDAQALTYRRDGHEFVADVRLPLERTA